ncbi:MAG: PEGA domain-containing protein [bacterium]
MNLHLNKRFNKIVVSILFIFILLSLDVYFNWTGAGTFLYNAIWQPALILDSLPSGASITLASGAEQVLPSGGITPIRLRKITNGIYTLTLAYAGYNNIEKKIVVDGKKITVSGGGTKQTARTGKKINIPLEATIMFSSYPDGAEVYIDGRKIDQKSPVEVTLAYGQYSVSMAGEGYADLGSAPDDLCVLELLDDINLKQGTDINTWSLLKLPHQDEVRCQVKGIFKKTVSIVSFPEGADVYLDGQKKAFGKTPMSKAAISSGKHTLSFVLSGYKTVARDVIIDEATNKEISVDFNKVVLFHAYEGSLAQEDINARVAIEGTLIKNRLTPFEAELPLKVVHAVFTKEPLYLPITKTVDIAKVAVVAARLSKIKSLVKIMVLEKTQHKPVDKAELLYAHTKIGVTNTDGRWQGALPAGEALITVETGARFQKGEKKLYIPSDTTLQEIAVYLEPPADGTLVVDMQPHFSGAKIYVDGDYVGDGVRKMTNMSRGPHTVSIRHYGLDKDVLTTIEFAKKKLIILKIDKNGEFYYE